MQKFWLLVFFKQNFKQKFIKMAQVLSFHKRGNNEKFV